MASFFNDPYFRNKPALASLEKIQNPTPEHVRSCLLEMARDIIAMKKQEPTPVKDETPHPWESEKSGG